MAELLLGTNPLRLEDFINLANQGADIQASVELKKQVVRKVDPETNPNSAEKIDTYLFMADYFFEVEGILNKLSKVYVFAVLKESKKATNANKNIANARLRADYHRLKAAKINLEEKYF